AVGVGRVVQHRHHRRHGQLARRVPRRAARLGRGVARRGLPEAVAQGAGELLAADHDPAVSSRGPLRPSRGMKIAGAVVVAILIVLPAFPSLLNPYAVSIFTLIFFYGFLGQSWNIVGGYAGQLSAGHAAFVG